MFPYAGLNAMMLEAARLCRASFASATASRKGDGSLVTSADELVEEYLIEQTARLLPGYSLYSEERGLSVEDQDHYIYIDPIDGTESYYAGLPTYAICFGVFARQQCQYARIELPAIHGYLKFTEERLIVEAPQPVALRQTQLFLVPSTWQISCQISHDAKVRSLGSIAFHLSLLIRGLARAALTDSAYLWDVAAALPMLQFAGVGIYTIKGEPVNLDPMSVAPHLQSTLLFVRPENLQEMLGVVRRATQVAGTEL